MAAGSPHQTESPVAVFIPSRDRALQLDGALRSFKRQCSDASSACISVLFHGTSRRHRSAYKRVAREHPDITLFEERSFPTDVHRLLGIGPPNSEVDAGSREPEMQLLVVDDTLFVEPFSLRAMASTLSSQAHALGFSLRLGETISYCQTLDITSPAPTLTRVDAAGDAEIVSFAWPGLEPDWGYPLELSSSLYRRQDLAVLIRAIAFDSPTKLEYELSLKTPGLAHERPQLLCYRKPRAVSLALNRVQRIAPNPTSGHERHEPSTLLTNYEHGWRVDAQAYDGYTPHACHEEAELLLTSGLNR